MALFGKRHTDGTPKPAEPVDVVGDLINQMHSGGSRGADADEELRRLRRETSDPEVAKRIARAFLEHQKVRGAVHKRQRAAPPLKAPAWMGDPSIPRRDVEFEYPHPGTDHWTTIKVTVNARGNVLSAQGTLVQSFFCKACPPGTSERSFAVAVERLLKHSELQRAIRELHASERQTGSETSALSGEAGRDVTFTITCVACGYKTNVTVTIDWTGNILSGSATDHEFRCQNCNAVFSVSKEFLKEHTNRFV